MRNKELKQVPKDNDQHGNQIHHVLKSIRSITRIYLYKPDKVDHYTKIR